MLVIERNLDLACEHNAVKMGNRFLGKCCSIRSQLGS